MINFIILLVICYPLFFYMNMLFNHMADNKEKYGSPSWFDVLAMMGLMINLVISGVALVQIFNK